MSQATTTISGVSALGKNITIINNVSNPNTQIDFGAGNTVDSTGSIRMITTAMTKILNNSGSWTAGTGQNGLLTGARANSSTYHCFVIRNPTTLAVDFGFLLGVNATTPDPTAALPSGFTQYKRIGSILTDGSGNIRAGLFEFFSGGYKFNFNTYIVEAASPVSVTTSRASTTITTPAGISVTAMLNAHYSFTNGGDTLTLFKGGTSIAQSLIIGNSSATNVAANGNPTISTSTSSQIDMQTLVGTRSTTLNNFGWIDYTN